MNARRLLPTVLLFLSGLAGCVSGQQTPAPATPQASSPGQQLSQPTATSERAPVATLVPQPAQRPPATFDPTAFELELELIAEGLNKPVHLTHAGDGSGRLFVVEQPGVIRIITDGQINPTPFLDIRPIVGSRGNEQGLLSVAFHPDYTTNGFFFVNYTDTRGDTVIARYTVSADPDVADPESAQTILMLDQPAGNHNGGLVLFGPDGYLYVGTGDGGRAGDPWDNAQNPQVLLGKMLRLDVDGATPYAIPPDNPFVNDPNVRDEIWALGLRNPWRYSFDRATGDLYIADVGQNAWEEIDFQPANSRGGENYGWNRMEGFHCFSPRTNCDQTGLTLPVAEYGHDLGCSVTGGHVYRGSAFPQMAGAYYFGDFCSGRIWALYRDETGRWLQIEMLDTNLSISSFGEDEAGELYVTSRDDGRVYRLIANTP